MVLHSLLPSRARYVAIELIGAKPSGIVVSDRHAVYDFVDVKQRQICWSHLLRDLTRISERAGLAGQVGRGLPRELPAPRLGSPSSRRTY